MILLIDEEPRYVGTYIEELRDVGYDVIYATQVDEALAILKTKAASIELVILDVMMPAGSAFKDEDTVLGTKTGLFFFRRLREIEQQLPVIILTNVTQPDVFRFFQAQDSCWFLRKENYDPAALAEQVQRVLQNPHKRGKAKEVHR